MQLKILNLWIFLFSFNSIILEADPTAVSYRVALRNDDIPIGEQTVAQVCLAIEVFKKILLNRNIRKRFTL